MNLLDLFSGIGGFHMGLEMAGFRFDKVYYSDIEEYPNKVYAKRFPGAIPLGDITKMDVSKIGHIDIVTGGFPCQDISIAGKQRGLKNESGEVTRSGLFYEIIRICGILRPKVIFLENVANLLSIDNGDVFREVIRSLAEIGYICEWKIVSAADVGAMHLRKRIWIVAYSGNSTDSAVRR